ncbi:hypothetical protein CFH99_18495 [Nocardioides aromaticivorans]|uniref:Sulfotransferase domain-containing protein n=1 Tax=Nocardioides aromaticivorans TaxID=200618 RepID=A0ABX7PPL2_9ACTN|nr:sulfotransferase domain-containing protein [Nocardioides aromaticivorans]QSR27617.1 hypothetical protein CFH99_18495 [Nocardioides aromaticivorans]
MTRHLLVIGGQRCGTTYLAGLLDAHPDITMARPGRPEPKVFLDDAILGAGLDGYRRTFFAHAAGEAVLGEKSTSYIEHPSAIGRAKALLGTPVVVAQLRDPVARAVSNYRFTHGFGLEERTLEQALSDNLEGSRPWDPTLTSVSPYAYLERGRYVDHLAPWLKAFPDSSHVCFLEEVTDADLGAAALAAVYDAVGVDPASAPPPPDGPVNASAGDEPDLPADLVTALRDHFVDSDLALSRLLHRDLPWATRTTTGTTTEAR